ncbi:hypothetical protein DEU56DRAFT_792646 [Suillus clintonianus]|uniref:uncharacterized protein n=1 Tax=Suillus clintonianus TaxID=1904413 RepID=UPI001B86E72F|nr:uncharacterized protein DEU56DRAFT_792646 [Suillus clintonianus]KAG2142949.1 hypothetical protein DEU56DRAFT_792646 [Suillus clintonianus]
MHQSLLIDEILSHIIQFVAADGQRDSKRLENTGDLARLARTCRSFMECAFDTLWRTQHSLSPLVMCLPRGTWEIHPSNVLYLTRPPADSEWARFDMYSCRVKNFSYPKQRKMIRLHEDALPLLFAERPPQSLFPSLSSLDFSILSCSSSNFPLIRGFLSPKLTSLTFTLPRKLCPESVRGVLEDLPRKATRIENITISSLFPVTSFELNVSTLGLPHLRQLVVSSSIHISAQSMLNIASLRYVQELNLSLHPDFDADMLRDRNNTFPALRHLSLEAHDLPQCVSLISFITSPRLEEVFVSYNVQARSTVITSFLSAIGTSLRAISLRHKTQANTTADHPFIFHSSTFAPLLACRNLRAIKLFNLGTLNLDDDFIIAAAKAWSELEELRLCSLPWSSITPSISLNALTALTQHCPQLTCVHMSLDARDVPELPLGGLSMARAQFLDVLNIRDSVIGDIESVAQFLGATIPNMTVLYVEAHPELRDKWMEVKAYYDRLRFRPVQDGR